MQVHHGCTTAIHVHDWIAAWKVSWIIGKNAGTTHQTLVNSNPISKNRLNSRTRWSFRIKGMIVLIGSIISSSDKANHSTGFIIQEDIPHFNCTSSVIQDAPIVGYCILHSSMNVLVDCGGDSIAAIAQFFSSQFLVGFDSVVVFQLLLRNIVPLNQVFVHGLLGFFDRCVIKVAMRRFFRTFRRLEILGQVVVLVLLVLFFA